MWFQDLFNYDFRRTEMCIIPYGTQLGEISLLRLQHGRRLAADHRGDAARRRRVAEWYRDERASPDLREGARTVPLPPSLGTVVMAEGAKAPAPEVPREKPRVRLRVLET